MKNLTKSAKIYFICSIAFYICAIVWGLVKPDSSLKIMWMAIGLAWMCLGIVQLTKAKADDKNSDKDGSDDSKGK